MPFAWPLDLSRFEHERYGAEAESKLTHTDTARYMIRSAAHPGQCLDAGGMQLGQSFLTTWACNRLPQQQWSYSQQRVFLGK